MEENNGVELTEVVFARAEGRRGRFLRIGEEDVALYQAVENALISRLGMTGVMQVALDDDEKIVASEEKWAVASDVDWLGIPILHPNKQLAYYLLGTFKKPTAYDRGAPFHGCLVTASELEKYELRYFIYAWNNLRQQDSQWLMTEETAGKVILGLKTDLKLTQQEDNSELIHNRFNRLEEGAVIRLPRKRNIFSLLGLMVNNPQALSSYSWTTAAFAFPSAPDGAQLHIALSKDRQFYSARETIRPTLLEDIQEEEETFSKQIKKEDDNSTSLSGVVKEAEFSAANKPPVTKPKTEEKPTHSKRRSYGTLVVKYGAVIGLLAALLWWLMPYFGGGGSMAPEEIALRLEPTYEQSLERDVETVALALSFLQNPQGEQNIKDQIQPLVPIRVNKVQRQIEKQVKENWKLIEKDALVQRWLLVLKELPNTNQSQKRQSKVIQSAIPGLQRAIDSINSTRSITELDNIVQIAGNYPELSNLESAAYDKRIWFNALIKTSQEFPSNSYYVLSNFIEENPSSRYVGEARQLRQKHLSKWHQEENAIFASIYTNMMTGKQSFDVETLKTAVNRYRKIPGGKTNHPAYKIAYAIQELEQGKEIYLFIDKIDFFEELKKRLAKIECYKKKLQEESEENSSKSKRWGWFSESCEEAAYKKTHQVELVTQFNGRYTPDTKRSIKDGRGTRIPVTVSFYGRTAIELKKEGRLLAKAEFYSDAYNNLIYYWINKQGETGKLTFYSVDNHEQLATATYKIPTPYDLGFPRWRF